jgi:tetratricopeptide (TPR) repeat protein
MQNDKWTRTVQKAGSAIECGNIAQGQKVLEKALEIAEKLGDPNLRAETLTLLGLCFAGVNDHEKAVEFHKRAVAIASVVYGFETLEHAQSMYQLAETYFEKCDYEVAESNAVTSFEIFSRLHDSNPCDKLEQMLVAIIYLLARISFHRGESLQARRWLEQYADLRGVRDQMNKMTMEQLELVLSDNREQSKLELIPIRIALYAPCF